MNLYITPNEHIVGLFSTVLKTLSNISAIEGSDDKLYVNWDKNLPYLDPSHGSNVWEYYFIQPFNVSPSELENPYQTTPLLGGGTPFYGIIRPSEAQLAEGRMLCKKYIRIQPHILKLVDDFMTENKLKNGEYFAMHRRGTDHKMDAPILPLEDFYREADELFVKYDKCVLCTDEVKTVDAFKERYGDKVCTYDAIRSEDDKGVHCGGFKSSAYKIGEDVMVEALLMSNSDFLIKTVSGVSLFSIYFNDTLNYKDIDLHTQK